MCVAQRARELLHEIMELTKSGVDTTVIVERASSELRLIVEREMTPTERDGYSRRIMGGEPVMKVLRELSRRA